ncbi:MAG: NADAR family protein [Polyangiaceae bacterium]
MVGSIRSNEALIAWLHTGAQAEYVYFWGHEAPESRGVVKQCLSQWFPCSFVVEGRHYTSTEQFMMSEKARLFGDTHSAERIMSTSSPRDAKKLGRAVQGFDEAEWTAARSRIVVNGNLAKFGQNAELGRFLRGTGDKVLVEASPLDRVWGVGLGANDPRISDPAQWQGLNLLGFALMEVRAELAE